VNDDVQRMVGTVASLTGALLIVEGEVGSGIHHAVRICHLQEMDYQLEAHNTMTFKQHMIGLQGVRVATVYPEFTSRKIIVTEWIEVGLHLIWVREVGKLALLMRPMTGSIPPEQPLCLACAPAQGERLGDSKAEDVRALCSTLLNCYLIQLLETGLLHADPHPGEWVAGWATSP
jgi:aarF domain-containing kinase